MKDITNEQLELSREYLNIVHPKINTTTVTERIMRTVEYDIDVIIPCFNVEKYIRACFDSVIDKTPELKLRIIAVDDGSEDETGRILDEYDQRDDVLVIHQKNKGLAGARNTGLDYASAKYLFFLDSDDMVSDGALIKLFKAAEIYDAEIVEGEIISFADDEKLSLSGGYSDEVRVIEPESMQGYVCGKLFKAEVFNDISFPEGYWFEDCVLVYLINPRYRKTYHIDSMVYLYRQNLNGITAVSHGNVKSIDAYWLREIIFEDMKKLGIDINQSLYETILDEIALTYVRTNDLELNVKVSIFYLTADWFNKLHQQFSTTRKFQSVLEKGLEYENYQTYADGCAILWNSKLAGKDKDG